VLALHCKHQVLCLCLYPMNAQYSLIFFQRKERSRIFVSDTCMQGISADTASRKLEREKKRLQRIMKAVMATEWCHSTPLFTLSARPGARWHALAPHSQSTCPVVTAEKSREHGSSWCISKSQKTDTEPRCSSQKKRYPIT